MLFERLATVLLGLPGLVQATALDNPPEGYSMVPMEWEVETFPGTHNLTMMKGTVEQVYQEVLKLNPNYEEEFAAFASQQERVKRVDKRTDFSTSKYFCNGRWKGASTGEIQKGIKYLRGLGGRPHLGPGPGKCSRERVDKDLLSFGSIADGAQWLVEYCTSVTGAQFPFTAGQIFHQTNWNVIVTNPGPCE